MLIKPHNRRVRRKTWPRGKLARTGKGYGAGASTGHKATLLRSVGHGTLSAQMSTALTSKRDH